MVSALIKERTRKDIARYWLFETSRPEYEGLLFVFLGHRSTWNRFSHRFSACGWRLKAYQLDRGTEWRGTHG